MKKNKTLIIAGTIIIIAIAAFLYLRKKPEAMKVFRKVNPKIAETPVKRNSTNPGNTAPAIIAPIIDLQPTLNPV